MCWTPVCWSKYTTLKSHSISCGGDYSGGACKNKQWVSLRGQIYLWFQLVFVNIEMKKTEIVFATWLLKKLISPFFACNLIGAHAWRSMQIKISKWQPGLSSNFQRYIVAWQGCVTQSHLNAVSDNCWKPTFLRVQIEGIWPNYLKYFDDVFNVLLSDNFFLLNQFGQNDQAVTFDRNFVVLQNKQKNWVTTTELL